MQRIKLYSLTLVAIIWFMVIIPYFLVQTSFGANLVAQYLFSNSTYKLTIGDISHSFSHPYEIILHDVTVTDKQTEIQYLQAQTVILSTHKAQPFSFSDLDYIIIQKGHLNWAITAKIDEVIQAKRLQLLDVSIDIDAEPPITITDVNGGVQPWSTSTLTDKSTDFQFNFTAQAINYNDVDVESVVLSGFQKNDSLFLNNVGGNIGKGFFLSKAKRLPNDDWIVDELQINHLNLQTEQSITYFQNMLLPLPKFTINYLALTDSSLEAPDLKIEKSNLELKNISYDKQWNIQNITLLFNANHVAWQDESFTEPMIQLSSNNNQFTIEKSASRWRDGMINLNGTWVNNKLMIDTMLVAGIHYSLPTNWQHTLQEIALPHYLSEVSVKKLTVMPSTMIDTQVDFPMQYTFFEARGNNLQLAKQQQWGLSQGKLTLKAEHATVNTMTLRHAVLELTATNNSSSLSADLSALTDTGLLEATAQLTLSEQQIHDLNITGYAVDPSLLSLWKIIETPITDKSFALQLAGKISPLQLSGQITLKHFTGDLTYPVQNNHIIVN